MAAERLYMGGAEPAFVLDFPRLITAPQSSFAPGVNSLSWLTRRETAIDTIANKTKTASPLASPATWDAKNFTDPGADGKLSVWDKARLGRSESCDR